MVNQYWKIQGFDSTEKIFDEKVKLGCFSDNQIKTLLKALAARHLDDKEILGAYAKKNTKIYNDLLKIRKDGPYPVYMCGENPHYIAKPVPE